MKIDKDGYLIIYTDDLCDTCIFCAKECPLHAYINAELVLPRTAFVQIDKCEMYAEEQPDLSEIDIIVNDLISEDEEVESEPTKLNLLDRIKVAFRVLFQGET